MDWKLRFLLLSGWPVFLAVVLAMGGFAWAMSVWLSRLAHRSVLQNVLLAIVALAVVAAGLLAVAVLLTRA
jgi:hypothetical protein